MTTEQQRGRDFIREVRDLARKRGIVISHEDNQGSFVVYVCGDDGPPPENEWFKQAIIQWDEGE